MGLDLTVEACPKPGHEDEWRNILQRSFADQEISEGEIERFQSISIPPFERLGAPRVGYDQAANDWIVAARGANTQQDAEAVIAQFHGHYALALIQSDGLPKYSHANLYEGVDETSFRGSFLTACTDILSQSQIANAWEHRMPETAIAYGQELLASAQAAEQTGALDRKRTGLLARLGLSRPEPSDFNFEEQLDIVNSAGRWFIFWGQKGHAIRAHF